MTEAAYDYRDLAEDECRRLLPSMPIGRLAFTRGALPCVLPVHFAVRNNEVCIRSLDTAKIACAARGDIVAFEVDSYTPATREGWCVNLVGRCRIIDDPAEIAELDALNFSPWSAEQRPDCFAITISMIHGRRLIRRHAPAPPPS